ncbi:GNAT family N-acetyltransferase [Pusillimonas sp. SM2304]|uniref:GNAT family N-acetyltransferase n=1 Tax=Pusillimonas sp. SM2304 TaxID=3073241 RepID=UPI0028766016|nr:GNAT family N-acetyltransferase [Pusillimonas sp. SM2304]MDS1142166.1 GNAT family N-acetyltransferase [Pusillimonas sp. SM2304]
MSRAVQHHQAAQRFEWTEDGILSELDYELQNGVMSILHTGVPEAVGGRGIAADLAKAALDTAREQGWLVRPVCSYVAAYIKKHPEYQALLA